MIIAVDMRCFLAAGTGDASRPFLPEPLKKIIDQHSEHQFLLVSDRPFDAFLVPSNNIIPVVIGPKAGKPLLWQFWYNYKLPSIIKKYKADVFLGTAGIISMSLKIPQCLLISTLDFLYFPERLTKSNLRYYKKYTPQFLQKATQIVTFSGFLKQTITEQYKIPAQKIDIINSWASSMYKPTPWEDNELVKEKYTGGKEYFLYTGEVSLQKNMLTLLKAFSFFKKRQKSNMQLLLVDTAVNQDEAFIKSLQSYKYREEVKLLTGLPEEELAGITAAAYAFVFPCLSEGIVPGILEALQSNIPVVAFRSGAVPEIGGDAVIYIENDNFEQLAQGMMLVFKDEQRRNELILEGKDQSQHFSLDKTAHKLWEAILTATKA